MDTLDPVEAFEIFLRAMEGLDVDRFVAMLDENVVLKFPYMWEGQPTECTGLAEAAEFLAIIPALFTEFRWVQPRIYATDDPELAMVITKSDATLTTGQHYDNDYVLLLRVRDGKVVEYWEHFDQDRARAAFRAIGA